MNTTTEHSTERKTPCRQCGAELLYAPGTSELQCGYCNYQQLIKVSSDRFTEQELAPFLESMGAQSHSEEVAILSCTSCGARQHVEEQIKSMHCAYCNSSLIVQESVWEEWILPGAIVPFHIDKKEAHRLFKRWVKKMWFAPNQLKKATLDPIYTKGLYLPFWTFDAQLFAEYSGKRGEYYYDTETTGTGNNRRTRRTRNTRWFPASGEVRGFVDDTLILAAKARSHRIPTKVAQWDLKALVDFHSSYLSGYVTEKYSIALKDGHLLAKEKAEEIARKWAAQDIGGNTQRIDSIDVQLSEETFKHILLPVYISSYRYKGKAYQFYVNGQNGLTSGNRPYSVWKITGVVLVAVIIFFLLFA